MSLATAEDVAARLGRALNPLELTQVNAYLIDAEAALLSKLPELLTQASNEPPYRDAVISVECAITLRAARLTDAVQSAYPNAEEWPVNPGSSRANVTVLDSEWNKLGLRWYTSFRLKGPGAVGPGFYPDMNPCAGPWWVIGTSDE